MKTIEELQQAVDLYAAAVRAMGSMNMLVPSVLALAHLNAAKLVSVEVAQ